MNKLKKLIMMANQFEPPFPYLCFEALEDGLQISLSLNACEYSLDGKIWEELPANTLTPAIRMGETIMFRGDIKPTDSGNSGVGTFSANKGFIARGNILALTNGMVKINCASKMFIRNKHLAAAEMDIEVSATNSYYATFAYTNITQSPIIRSSNGKGALIYMFQGCTSLSRITYLAMEPLTDSNVRDWVLGVPKSGTIILNKNIAWNPDDYRGSSGIPEGWEVKYCNPDNIDDVRDYKEIDKAWN